MICQTRIFIFLIFSFFLFYIAELNVMFFEQTHQYVMQYPANDKSDFDHHLSDDTHNSGEDGVITTTISTLRNTRVIKIVLTLNNRLLIPIILEHWEPPK